MKKITSSSQVLARHKVERGAISKLEHSGQFTNQPESGNATHKPSPKRLRDMFVLSVRQCARIKPFEQWVAERPRTAEQIEMYADVSRGCFRLARQLQSAYLAARVED